MKLLKFLLWMATVFIVAYFLTDLKIGDKNFKQHIDSWISKSKKASEYKSKFYTTLKKNAITRPLVPENKQVEAPPVTLQESKPGNQNDEITDEDVQKLLEVLKNNP